jgi:putative ABC transport system substrate-binding protein
MRRRDFITLLGGAAAAWPIAARGQQPVPVVGLIQSGSLDITSASWLAAFRAGLAEAGFVEGHNVTIESHFLEGQYDHIPAAVADLVQRRVAVIATPGSTPAALAAKAATTIIPIVFGVGDDPVRLGLVANLARPGGNATGVNSFSNEAVPKRLGLLHELLPKATPVAALINPQNTGSTEASLRELQEAARAIGLPIEIIKASTGAEIEAAFATLRRERIEALFVAGSAFFSSRGVQIATLASRHRIATSLPNRELVEAGGLMSYGTNIAEEYRQAGVYAGRILKGAKPSDLPVVQATRFELVINMQTARALDIAVPPDMLVRADKVID